MNYLDPCQAYFNWSPKKSTVFSGVAFYGVFSSQLFILFASFFFLFLTSSF